VYNPPLPSTPAAPESRIVDENTVDVVRPARTPLDRLMASKAVFGVAFVVGFIVTFVPGALIFFHSPDPAALYQQQRYAELINFLDAKKKEGKALTSQEWLLDGHAHFAEQGQAGWQQVLDAYKIANKHLDRAAFEVTVKLLGNRNEQARARAIAILADAPGDEPKGWLLGLVRDANVETRHGVLAALKLRTDVEPAELALAVVAVTSTDVKGWSCGEGTGEAFDALLDLVAKKQGDALGNENWERIITAGPSDLVALNDDARKAGKPDCVSPQKLALVKTSIAPFVKKPKP
jgi:hypothetical protein